MYTFLWTFVQEEKEKAIREEQKAVKKLEKERKRKEFEERRIREQKEVENVGPINGRGDTGKCRQ